MKKLVFLFSVFILATSIFLPNKTEAAYLPEHDKYVEVSSEEARIIADSIGLKNVPLGAKTAKLSFELQERLIAEIEKVTKREIDHYYIWLTVNGEPVLAIDPPVPTF